VLRDVRPPPRVPGALRLAEPSDWPLVSAWAPLFMRDTGASGSVLNFLERRLATRSLFVWEHDGPKCMAAVSGYTPNGLRVSAVFTPEAERRRGYASNTVATLSQRALDGGRRHCVLFAESHHTATLRVYAGIGYRPLHSTVVIDLTPA
jgi:predicted GNAT family acetyltransferase